VDGLKLGVGEADLNQGRKIGRCMKKLFKVAQGVGNLVGRRRNEGCLRQSAAARSDPILRAADFPRREVGTANPAKQFGVNFLDKPDGEREFRQAGQPVVHRTNVVHYFRHVLRLGRREDAGLGREKIVQRALRAFDLAGKHRLLAHIHENEEVRVRQCQNRAVEPAKRPVGLGEQAV
jgi:hypothetical protein